MTIKTITRLLATVAIVAIAIPAAAAEPDCITVGIGHESGTRATSVEGLTDGSIRYSVNGSFVWFTWGHPDDFDSLEAPDTLSFDVSDPDVVAATACLDGSVAISRAEPTTTTTSPQVPDQELQPDTPAPTTTPVREISRSLAPLCDIHPDTLAYYCTLPNRVFS